MADQDAKNQRRAAKRQFTRKLTELMKSIEEDKGSIRNSESELRGTERGMEKCGSQA